ncbi:MAG: cysteine desulfurase [Planctomycetes bacterium]|nr:cysteine desulfurase [Planctomycetota bacterium]
MSNRNQRISFDANAGVPVSKRALEKFVEVATTTPANPASIHQDGRAAQAVIESSKINIAKLLNCSANELFFTSGATEANNLAIHGLIYDLEQVYHKKPILVSSLAEHPSCLSYLRVLQQKGYSLHLLDLSACAQFDINNYVFSDDDCYVLVGQWVNNETGCVQNISKCSASVADNVRWHCDAVQGFGKIPFDDCLLNSDSFSISGHKFGAPKGVGLLRLKNPSNCAPLLWGGGQQNSLRPGTESPELAASFYVALDDAMRSQVNFSANTASWRNLLLSKLENCGCSFQINSDLDGGLPNTLNISFPGIDGRMILPALDTEKISLSSGSACASGAALASSVLVATGVDEKLAQASIRVSFRKDYPDCEVDHFIDRLVVVIRGLYKVAIP